MMVVQFFVVLFFYPQTERVSLEEMQHRLGIEYSHLLRSNRAQE
jgi:hypothetical protein